MSRGRRRRERQAVQAQAKPPDAAVGPGLPDRIAEIAGRIARRPWAFPAILVVLTLAVYARSLPMGLAHFDDDVYLFEDPRLNELSPSNLGAIVARPFFANYHPVTTLTYAFDRAVWGKWLPGFRATHLAFYAGGVVLLYYLFRMLLGSPNAAFAGAAIYATHAIHVEAVAWLAQRKDVVCLVFYAASVLAYVRYSREKEKPWRLYAASLALAVLACLSKGYAVVLPGVFIAYDLCFPARWCASRSSRSGQLVAPSLKLGDGVGRATAPGAGRLRWRQVIDKLPFIAVSALVTAATIYSQEDIKALVASSYTTGERFVLLCKVFAAYVGRTILPVRLSGLYLTGRQWLGAWAVAGGMLFAVAAITGFLVLRRRRPAVAFGIALFMLPLSTVMNVLRFTLRIWIADRYLFFPTIGSSLALAAAGLWLFRRSSKPSRPACGWALAAAAGATVVLYSALTVARIPVWGGPVALWSDALRKYSGLPGSGPVTEGEIMRKRPKRLSRRLVTALARAHGRTGNDAEAKALVALAERLGGGADAGVDLTLARVALREGRYDEAIRLARKAADAGEWNAPDAWGVIGNAHAEKKDYDGAREAFAKALEIKVAKGLSGADAMQDLGLVELRDGKLRKAAEWYRRSREADPEYPKAALGLGMVYEEMGRLAEAVEQYREVLRLDPDHPQRKGVEAKIAELRGKLSGPGPGGGPK